MGRVARSHGSLPAVVILLAALGCDAPSSAAPSAESLLRGSLEFLQTCSSAKVVADVSMQITESGQLQTMNSTATICCERPDKFALVTDAGMLGVTLMTDGSEIVVYLPMLNVYSISTVGDKATVGGLPGVGSFVESMRSFDADETYDQIMRFVTQSEYVGREKVGDIECHHCRYESSLASIDVWFEEGEQPLVRKVASDLTKIVARQTGQDAAAKDERLRFVVTFKDWDTSAKLTDADFQFTPPAGAEQVDTLLGSRRSSSRGPHPLLGQLAPPFEVQDLDGQTVSLSKFLGKNVVVLDFWATWCGPCVAALPEISQVTNSLKDRGVVFYAVDVGEEQQTVVDFLKTQKFDLPVLLDAKSSVAASYRVTGIPQTVLIGKDGKVQVVHVGFGAGLAPSLTAELEQLLAGKDLASAEIAEASQAKSMQVEASAEGDTSPE